MSAKPLPSTPEADELSEPAAPEELSPDDLPDEDDARMMEDLQRRLDRFTRPIAAIERMTSVVNKFDFVNKFDSVSRFHPQLGAMSDLVAAHSREADLFRPAAAAAELIAGHQHAADLVHQATVAAELIAGHQHAADLAHQIAAATEMITGHKYATDFLSEVRAATEVFQVHKELMAATTPWREMMDLAKTYGIGDTVLNQFSRMSELDHGLARFLPSDMSDHWSAHLKLAAVPALSFLAHDWPKPVGLLAELSEAPLGASISWLFPRNEGATPMIAAVIPDDGSEQGIEVVVEGDPICAICGGPLISLGSETRWVGPKRGIRHQRLFPACSNCFALERENPGTLLRILTDLARPAFRVIDGGRRGNGTPRGHLRLVRRDEP